MKSLTAFAFIIGSLFTQSSFADGYSYSSCRAYTQCYGQNAYGQMVPNGVISCQVYGSSYVGSGVSQSQCAWSVIPYQAVHCEGYTRSTDYTGASVWGYENIDYSCP